MMSGSDYHNADTPQVSNSQFLDTLALAAPKGAWLWTNAFIGNPDGHPGWHGRPYDGSQESRGKVDNDYRLQNSYFCTAALRELDEQVEEGGALKTAKIVRRRKANFVRLLALVVDDANVGDIEGSVSWVLNTSPGKKQVGFFLSEDDPLCADLKLVDALVTRMAAIGLISGDKSGNNAVRYVRLPQGQNQKPRDSGPYQVHLTHWAPDVRYTLEDAAAALNINLDEIRVLADSPQPASTGAIHGEQDEKLRIATQNIIAGNDMHESVNIVAASLIASGTQPGAVVNTLRALMDSSQAPRNERWTARYNDIPRSVSTAFEKFRQPGVSPALSAETQHEPLFRRVGPYLDDIRPIDFIVDGYLESDALSMVFGPSSVGKSFVVIDIACCVATGEPWHGMKVKQGPVFILIGEGMNGYFRRLKAWSTHYKVSLADAPLYVSRHAVGLSDQMAAMNVAAEIDRMIRENGQLPSLIVLDTFARMLGDGDENSAQDVSRFISNIDLYLKGYYKTNVLIVHHSGHEGERARGSSALKAALDQEFKVSGMSGRPKLECTKMKDAEMPIERTFKITGVKIGVDAEGIEITGAVAVPDGNPLEFQVSMRSDGRAITAGQIVKQLIEHVKGYEQLAINLECGQSAARKAIERVVQAGLLEKNGRWFALSEDGLRQAKAACWIPGDWQP